MARNRLKPITGPVKVTLDFYFKPPKSYNKKRLQAIKDKEELLTNKMDLDNLIKGVLDGLNGVTFKDDSQIIEITSSKNYGESDYTDVAIEIIEGS